MLKKHILGGLLGIVSLFAFTPMTFADSYDDLARTKEYTIKSIKPTDENFAYILNDYLYQEMSEKYDGWHLNFSKCNENYTSCKLTKYDVEQGKDLESDFYVKVNYVYNENIKKVIDNLKDNLNKNNYSLTDLDYFSWIIAYLTQVDIDASKGIYDATEEPSMIMFSTEFKQNVGYKNFFLDLRLGDDFPLYTLRGGNGVYKYDDTIYYISPDPVLSSYNHIFYINDDATDIAKAIKERLESNTTHKFEVEDTRQTVEQFLIDEFKTWYNSNNSNYQNEDEYAQAKLEEIKNDSNHDYHYLVNYLNEHVYIIDFDFENVGAMDFVIPVKDSNKVTNIEFKSNDIGSDISISTNSVIPLDTLINVAKLTNGEEYEKIVKILNMTNFEMFDLKLFSKSANDYITKLENGTFEVKIPITEEFKGKDLIVYYVDENNKVKDYEVTPENGYAKFYTNHFSIYTLAVKENTSTNNNINNVNNPNTYDKLSKYVIIGLISLISLIVATIYLKTRNKA